MLSMCGLLCSVLRGWRHNQAVMLMARALSQANSSLLVQDLASGSGSGPGRGGFSPFCVMEGEKGLSQLLWCDNNKQAIIVSPRVSFFQDNSDVWLKEQLMYYYCTYILLNCRSHIFHSAVFYSRSPYLQKFLAHILFFVPFLWKYI